MLSQAESLIQQRANQLRKNEKAAIAAMKNGNLLPELNSLCRSEGVEVLSMLEVDKHMSYTHTSSIHDFQKAVCDQIDKDLHERITSSQYFSILIDESTDMAVNQNMLVYIRIVHQGELETHFLSLNRIKTANAETLCDTVIRTLEEKNLDLNKLVGIATDGAATMIGRKSGVVVRLRNKVPYLLTFHCIAHCLALASAQAADAVPYLIKFQEIVNSVYKYFEYSPKNMAQLEEVQKLLKEANDSSWTQRFQQVLGTRWLSFEGSLEALLANYSVLLTVLSGDKSAKGLLKSTSTYKFLYVASFMADAMSQICMLSRMFQKTNIDCSVINDQIEGCISTLTGLLTLPGAYLSKFIKEVSDQSSQSTVEIDGHVIRYSDNEKHEAEKCCKNFIETVTTNMRTRFLDAGNQEIFKGFSVIFNPTLYPKSVNSKDSDYLRYGMESIKILLDHFKTLPGFDSVKAQLEFPQFKCMIIKSVCPNATSMAELCKIIALGHSDNFPNLAILARVDMILPVSTVEVERGFSQQNLIKTRTRTRLLPHNLEMLMKIVIEGPAIEDMDFQSACKIWGDSVARRLLNTF